MIITGVAGASTALFCAPVLLKWAAPGDMDWGELSDISQTYGTPLSAAALLGVIISLAYQARQTTVEREEAQRAGYRELILWSMNDPDLIPCWQPFDTPVTAVRWKQLAYTNLIMNAWRTDYRLRRAGSKATRTLLETHFRGELARAHWENSRATWRRYAVAEGTRRGIRFVDLVDEAYEEATTSGPAILASSYLAPPGTSGH
ncbi:DUF6082 family protein [Streptomyces chartreusis]|uniref:DUF6082 family protein n=1 Tax=Streptomyces chartreusis TaxID=1969 RepID=UPI0037F7443B